MERGEGELDGGDEERGAVLVVCTGTSDLPVAHEAAVTDRMCGARAERAGLRALFPSPAYCTDNAVMIAGLGYEAFVAGRTADLALDASSR